jgi:Flp pilus assembly protein CpaB
MILAGLLGATATLLALRATDNRVSIAVARTDLAAGTRVDAAAITTRRVELDSTLRTATLTARDIEQLRGATLLIPITAGSPIPEGAIAPSAARNGQRALSLPIAPERAVGGRLRAGDRVDVYTAGQRGTNITNDVEVLDVIRTNNGPLTASDSLTVVLAVSADQANRIAPIVGSSDVVLVQSTGATPAKPPEPPTGLTPMPAELPAINPEGGSNG